MIDNLTLYSDTMGFEKLNKLFPYFPLCIGISLKWKTSLKFLIFIMVTRGRHTKNYMQLFLLK